MYLNSKFHCVWVHALAQCEQATHVVLHVATETDGAIDGLLDLCAFGIQLLRCL